MKRLNLLVLALALTTFAFAQGTKNFSLGPRVGANFAKLTNVNNANSKSGLLAGITSTYSINERSGLTVDLLYSAEGVETKTEPQVETDLDYLRLMLAYDIFFRDFGDNFRPKIYLGPNVGVLLSADTKVEGSDTKVDVKDSYNTLDVGLTLGLGFNLRVGGETWLNVDGRYQPGFTNIINNKPSSADAVRNQNFQVSVGLAFGL